MQRTHKVHMSHYVDPRMHAVLTEIKMAFKAIITRLRRNGNTLTTVGGLQRSRLVLSWGKRCCR